MEKDYLSITTADANFVTSNCLNALDALCAYILCENHNLVLNLETTEVAALSTSKQELFSGLAKY
jgi:hypothetical protein